MDSNNTHQIRDYLMAKPEAREVFPFGPEAAVFKVRQKLFAILVFRQGGWQLNLKCDPDEAQALRDFYPAVLPGYHMNKKHWNSVLLDQTIAVNELHRMVDRSYCLVVKGLKRSERQWLENRYPAQELYRQTPSLLGSDTDYPLS